MRSMRRRRDDTAKGAGHAVTLVIGHDQQDVGRTLGRHHGRWPIRFGIFGIHIDRSAKRRGRGRKILAVYCRRGAGWNPACRWSAAGRMLRGWLPSSFLRRMTTKPVFSVNEHDRIPSAVLKTNRGANRGPYAAGILRWERQQSYWTKGQLKRELSATDLLMLGLAARIGESLISCRPGEDGSQKL